jgi:PAS domain S-box-containing protein/putative nucleotidyltransferase with HDIG domain
VKSADKNVTPSLREVVRSLKLPLVLCALFSFALLGVEYLSYAQERTSLERQAQGTLTSIAALKATTVQRWLRERYGDAEALSQEFSRQEDVLAWLATGAGTDGLREHILKRLKSLDVYDNYADVLLVDPQGTPKLSMKESTGFFDERLRRLARQTARTGLPAQSDLSPSPGGGYGWRIGIAVPIVDARAAKTIAIVVLTVDPARKLLPFIEWWPGDSRSGETMILVREGDRAELLNTLRHAEGASAGMQLPLSGNTVAAAAAQGATGILEGRDYRGVRVIAASTAVEGTPWYVVAKLDASEIYHPLYRRIFGLALVIATLIGAMIVGLIAAWRHQQYSLIKQQLEAESRQREVAERLQHTIATMQEGYIRLSSEWVYLDINDAAVRHSGRHRDELLGKNILDLFPGIRQTEVFTHLKSVMETRQAQHFEAPYRFADGATRWYDFLADPAPDGIAVFSIDITERKRREEQLDLARLIIANSPVLMLETGFGDFERIVYASENVSRYGYRVEDVVGKKTEDFIHPADRQRVAAYVAEVARGNADNMSIEFRTLAADGSYHWVEDRSSVVRRENGELSGFRAVLIDIDERRAAEDANATLASIVTSSDDAIISTDLNGTILTWNAGAAAMFGYAPKEAIGRDTSFLAPPELQEESRQVRGRVLAGNPQPPFETVRLRKDGSKVDVSIGIFQVRDSGGSVIGFSAMARDITARKRAELALRRTTRAMRTLSLANEALVRVSEQQELFQRMCDIIVRQGGYRMAWIGIAEEDAQKSVRPVAWSGLDDGYLTTANISWADSERGRGPTGTAIREQIPQVIQNFSEDPRVGPWRDDALARGYAASIALPLKSWAGVFGSLTIYAPEPDAFGADEKALLADLAEDLSFGVEMLEIRADRQQALSQLEHALEKTVQVVASTVEMRDPYTAGHQRRVAMIADAIAEDLGISIERKRGLHLAGILHDLGKISVPAEILSKPGRLTAAEFELIKGHSQVGYDIMKQVEFPWPVADIILQHHERLDGKGYPKGLKADEILLEAKILAVADVVESMMSHRPYRPALGLDAALAEIEESKGERYDPAVVDACIKVMRSGALKLDAA